MNEDNMLLGTENVTCCHCCDSFAQGTIALFKNGTFNILFISLPLLLLLQAFNGVETIVFALSLIFMLPLTERFEFMVNQLTIHCKSIIAEIIQESVGNLIGLIIAIFAIVRGNLENARQLMIGIIFSNILLVMGSNFLQCGILNKMGNFSKLAAQKSATILVLAILVMLSPSVLVLSGEDFYLKNIELSRATSIILLLLYFSFFIFQLTNQKDLSPESETSSSGRKSIDNTYSFRRCKQAVTHASNRSMVYGSVNTVDLISSDSGIEMNSVTNNSLEQTISNGYVEEQQPVCSMILTITWLIICLGGIIYTSYVLCSTIESAALELHTTSAFLAAVPVSIVSTLPGQQYIALEKRGSQHELNKSIQVALSSSIYTVLLMLPTLVIVAWCQRQAMSIVFSPFEMTALLVVTFGVAFAIKNGTSHWLLGLLLVDSYVVVSIGLYMELN